MQLRTEPAPQQTLTDSDAKKQAIDKIIRDQLIPHQQHFIMRTNGLLSTAEIKTNIGQSEYECAALIYKFQEWKETKKTKTELLAVVDQALTFCPYHTGLLKICIDLAKAAQAELKQISEHEQADALSSKLETYYKQLLTHQPHTENYFAYAFFVAIDPTRQEMAMRLFLLGMKKDTHAANTPNALRREALKRIMLYINTLLDQSQKEKTKEAVSAAMPEFGTVNSLDVHTLARYCRDKGHIEESIFCTELYIWLIVTGIDTKSESQKFLGSMLRDLASTYMHNILENISANNMMAALVFFDSWLDALKKFPQDKSLPPVCEQAVSQILDTLEVFITKKQFNLAGAKINEALTISLVPDINRFNRLGTTLIIENLLDLADKSLDDKPRFDEATGTIEKMCLHDALRASVHSRIVALREKAKMPRSDRLMQEGYRHYLANETTDAAKKLTLAILCKDAKGETPPSSSRLQHAYVLRSLCRESKADRATAEEIDKTTAKVLFYHYRRVKSDIHSRSIKTSDMLKHAECYLLAKEASEEDDRDEAIAALNDAFTIYRGNEEAWLLHGKQFYFKEDYATAITSFSNSIALEPNQILAYFYRAFCRKNAMADLLTGVRNYRFSTDFQVEDIIPDLITSLQECQDQFIEEHRSSSAIVELTKKIKNSFPAACTVLLLERAHVWQKLNCTAQAIHDLQLAFFLAKTNIDTKCDAKSVIPNILCNLVVALLDGSDPVDLQNALDHLRKNDFSVAPPDAKEYEEFNAKQSLIDSAQNRMRAGTKPKKLTPPENIQTAIELKSLITEVNNALNLSHNADLLKTKSRVSIFLLRYAQGGNNARVASGDKTALFDICTRLNAALLKKPVTKEVKESKSSTAIISTLPDVSLPPPASESNTGSVTQPSNKAKRNKNKKLAKEEKQQAAARKRSEEIAAWIKSTETAAIKAQAAQSKAALEQKKAEEAQDKAAQEQKKADAAQCKAVEDQKKAETAQNKAATDQKNADAAQRKAEQDQKDAEVAQRKSAQHQKDAEIAQRKSAQHQQTAEQELKKIVADRKEFEEKYAAYLMMKEIMQKLILPAHLVAAMRQFQTNGERAAICGGRLGREIRRVEGLPAILGETDSDLVVGLRTKNPEEIMSTIQKLFPNAHVFQIPGDDKDGYTFRIKYPLCETNSKFIYDEKQTIDIRVSKALSNFDISEKSALCDHARTSDFVHSAIYYNGKILFDAARAIGMSSALSKIEQGTLTPIKSYLSDPLMPLRAIYKYGRNEGIIPADDIELFKTLTPEFFATLGPGVINNWLKKILCHGHAVKNLNKMLEAELIEKLFPFSDINHRLVTQELLDIAAYTDESNPADFDAIYSHLIQVLTHVAKVKTSWQQIAAQSQLFQHSFAIYKTDQNYCLTKLQSYHAVNKVMPHFMRSEIDSLGHQMHKYIVANFISHHAVQNFHLSMPLLSTGFNELTILLKNENTLKLITNYLDNIARKPKNYQLADLYAFWILTIVASDPRLTIEAVINSNLYFKLVFIESVDTYDHCFTLVRGSFIYHASQLGIHIPDNVLKPRQSTSHKTISEHLKHAASCTDEKSLAQATGPAPKSPSHATTAPAPAPRPSTTAAPEFKLGKHQAKIKPASAVGQPHSHLTPSTFLPDTPQHHPDKLVRLPQTHPHDAKSCRA